VIVAALFYALILPMPIGVKYALVASLMLALARPGCYRARCGAIENEITKL